MRNCENRKIADKWIITLGTIFSVALIISEIPTYRIHYDDFYLANLALDVFRNEGSLLQWHLIAAPRIFPELLIYFAAVPIAGDIFKVTFLVSVLIVGLQVFIVALIAREICNKRSMPIYVAIVFISLNALLGEEFTAYSRPGWHMGAFINLLFCLWLLVRSVSLFLPSVLMLLICALGVISDFLFLALIVPAVFCWYVVICWGEKTFVNRRGLLMIAAMIVGCVLGVVGYYLFVPNPVDNPVNASSLSLRAVVSNPIASFLLLFDALVVLLNSGLFISSMALMIAVLFAFRLQILELKKYIQVAAFLVGGAIANECILAFGSLTVDRYQILSINGLTVFISVSIALLIFKYSVARFLLPVLPLLVLISSGSNATSYPLSKEFQKRLDDIACITQHAKSYGIENGAAGYRFSQAEPVYSNNSLKILPLKGQKTKIASQFYSDQWLDKIFYFVIANTNLDPQNKRDRKMIYKLAVDDVIPILGKPDQIHECGVNQMLIYLSGLKVVNGSLVKIDEL